MKIQPSLFLTSFCMLLASAAIVEAQSPRPRFGYGSAPAEANVKTPPKKAETSKPKTKLAVTSAAKAKPRLDSPTAKPKIVAAAKSSSSKTTGKGGPAKPVPGKSTKEIAVAKTKAPSSKTAKPVIAKVNPPARASKTTAPSSKSVQVAKTTPARAKPSPASGNSPTPLADKAKLSTTGPADIARTHQVGGFNFFGAPIVLPNFPEPGPPPPSTDRKAFVDLMAARHSLDSPPTIFRPHLPEPKVIQHQPVPVLAARNSKPALQPFVERAPENAAGSAPEIAPATLAAHDFEPSATVAGSMVASTDLLDEASLARTTPASLSLATASASREVIPETSLLDEPALPSPVLSSVEKQKPNRAVTKPTPAAPEPPLPTEPAAASLPEVIAAATGDHDLSERERAFVRSLAEAASTVTTASGQMNRDLPASITTAAASVMDQIPAETVSSFRSVAKAARKSLQDAVPDLPLDMGTDLMPNRPDQMPDQLPNFNAATSGKIDVQSDRQADYDQANNKVIFTGKVELNSASIRLRAERVEVFMKKGGGGMERVEARGNVLMRTQDTANGPGQMASAGRASYNLKTGEITLSEWPKIQEAGKSHISTDPATKMYMFTDGRLRTDGPNRTLIGGGS